MNNDFKCYTDVNRVLFDAARLYKVPCATQGVSFNLPQFKFLTLFFLIAEVLDPKIN